RQNLASFEVNGNDERAVEAEADDLLQEDRINLLRAFSLEQAQRGRSPARRAISPGCLRLLQAKFGCCHHGPLNGEAYRLPPRRTRVGRGPGTSSSSVPNVSSGAPAICGRLTVGMSPTASAYLRYVSMEATTTRASTVIRSMPTSEMRTHASMTIPLSSTRSRTSIKLDPPDTLSTAI